MRIIYIEGRTREYHYKQTTAIASVLRRGKSIFWEA